jgi:DNA-binding NtrC family response regulator
VSEYLLPRFVGLIAHGWLTAPREIQQEQLGRVVRPLIDLASFDTMSNAFRYVYTSIMVWASGGNLSLAARKLGIDRSTLVRTLKKMQRAGLDLCPDRIEASFIKEFYA